MTRLVVDASVAAKWFLRDRTDEAHAEKALTILVDSRSGQVSLHQPPHFVAEIAAVLVRLKPKDAHVDLDDLMNMEFRYYNSRSIYLCALELATRLNHHLFDTLYHAVALSVPQTTLITADDSYYRKAQTFGAIRLLYEAL